MRRRLFKAAAALLLTATSVAPSSGHAQTATAAAAIDRNVVYGMVGGLALLMDVHRPDKPNGLGVVAIIGTAWRTGPGYDDPQMKEQPYQLGVLVKPLVSAGYTVFAINHRSSPQFRYPAPVEDSERAVRFVRFHATRFGIAPDRIGAVGASSGGHLVSMLGVRSGPGDSGDTDAVNRENARVQAVVAFCAPADFSAAFPTFASTAIASLMGMARPQNQNAPELKLYQAASPIQHVSRDDAPVLLIHGDNDDIVPFDQSEKMEAALRQAQVATKLIRVPGSGHDMRPNPERVAFGSEMIRWFDINLRRQ